MAFDNFRYLAVPLNTPLVELIQPLELYQLLCAERPIFLLDVREPEEHELVRIAGSVLIPLMELESRADEVRAGIASAELAVVYCRVGARSRLAAQWCSAQGMTGLRNLRGGINAYALEADRTLTPY